MEKKRKFLGRLAAVSGFISAIAYVLLGYYTGCWTWTLFVFLFVPLSYALFEAKIIFTYEAVVIAAYLVLGFTIDGWHPWWVLFLTIPVYHVLFDDPLNKLFRRIRGEDKEEEKVKEVDAEEIDKD